MASSVVSGNQNGHHSKISASDDSGTENSTKSKLAEGKTLSIQDRLLFHDRLHRLSRCDLETPASIVANVNIKQLLTPAAFDHLPTKYQNELIRLLPETDRIPLDSTKVPFAMTVNALSNEFFAKSCVEYRDRLRNGEFCLSSASSRIDIDPVVWECDAQVLKMPPVSPSVPKAGAPFICTSYESYQAKQNKLAKKKLRPSNTVNSNKPPLNLSKPAKPTVGLPMTSITKGMFKSTKTLSHTKTISPSAALAKLAVSKAKAQAASSISKSKDTESSKSFLAGTKRSHPNSPVSPTKVSISSPPPNTSKESSLKAAPVAITSLEKMAENNSAGEKVTKVVPIVVRNPHGQVVTTLANCNPLLTQMIKSPVNSQTPTAAPIKKDKTLQNNLPTILRYRNKNPVIVTLRKNPNIVPGKLSVSKAVNEVLAKVRSPANGSKPSPVIVTVSSNGSVTSKIIPKSLNLERSKQICESSKQGSQTLDLERSYEICKQVLGKSVEGATIVVLGPGGKRKIISNKPVRNRHLLDTATSSSSNGLYSSDIPVYKNKFRNGKSQLTLSGHVFLALNKDEDGYAAKAYKRRTAFRQKPKKKLIKLPTGKKATNQVPASSVPTTATSGDTSITTESKSNTSQPSSVTTLTDTIYATQPVLSVTESKTNIMNGVSSLLNSCMCSQRALVVCNNCGAFCHAECGSKGLCLACC